jgi:uncharacterized lipoprotein YajG
MKKVSIVILAMVCAMFTGCAAEAQTPIPTAATAAPEAAEG